VHGSLVVCGRACVGVCPCVARICTGVGAATACAGRAGGGAQRCGAVGVCAGVAGVCAGVGAAPACAG
jgi:hypothetical protein